ncbi:MAG TPA: hypothetical protein PLO89_09330 [Spirochaetota bacterium]|nr:hypothetical protein [Spirochaetota bacterium]
MFYSQAVPEKALLKLESLKVLKKNEKVIAFYDNSLFLSASKGIICVENEIRVYAGQKINYYKINEIKDIEFREVDKESYAFKMILITKEGKEYDITPASIPNDEMKLFIDVINMHRSRLNF